MASLVTKVNTLIMTVALLYSLLLLHTSSVEAVDIIGYSSTTACDGSAVGCYNAPINLCCLFNTRPSVRFTFAALENCQTSVIYTGNGCQNTRDSRSGPLDICFLNYGKISAARYYSTCGDSDVNEESSATCGLSSDAASQPCTSTALPNAVMYTVPGSTNGTWILESSSDKVDDMLAQLQSVPLDQKVGWLQGLGAHFKAKLDQQLKEVDGSLL